MKTYGQIDWERRQDHMIEENCGGWLAKWENVSDKARRISEAGAQAVIEEFKRRHNIVIPPEED